MSSPAVTTEQRDNVLICHIDDGKANALSKEIIAAVIEVVRAAEHDEAVAALVVHGRPGRFSAGFDLSVMTGGDFGAVADLVCDGGELVRTLYGSSLPVVAACTGHALAAGALLLLGCDLRVGADIDCKIGLNEVAIGMVLPDWAFTIAVDRLSRRHLQTSLATASVTAAAEAVDVGYLDAVAPADTVLDVAVAHAARFAALDLRAYEGTVRRLRGEVLDLMRAQIDADRAAGAVPTV
jgi:enoyl-CoA hydratase